MSRKVGRDKNKTIGTEVFKPSPLLLLQLLRLVLFAGSELEQFSPGDLTVPGLWFRLQSTWRWFCVCSIEQGPGSTLPCVDIQFPAPFVAETGLPPFVFLAPLLTIDWAYAWIYSGLLAVILWM